MASGSRGKELEEQYTNLSIEGDDELGLIIEEPGEEHDTTNYSKILIGKFLSDRSINFGAMRDILAPLWRLVKGMHIQEVKHLGLYMFTFFHDRDVTRVMEDGL
ncbi:hypothetical protein Scep_030220 [Stephania cephalantha]|uniref:DUF4283 domain-containing protein n=1 Tax=Stephania cephalantha TaxID=152367 RepID=A0AAP0DZ58_9MAGN